MEKDTSAAKLITMKKIEMSDRAGVFRKFDRRCINR